PASRATAWRSGWRKSRISSGPRRTAGNAFPSAMMVCPSFPATASRAWVRWSIRPSMRQYSLPAPVSTTTISCQRSTGVARREGRQGLLERQEVLVDGDAHQVRPDQLAGGDEQHEDECDQHPAGKGPRIAEKPAHEPRVIGFAQYVFLVKILHG